MEARQEAFGLKLSPAQQLVGLGVLVLVTVLAYVDSFVAVTKLWDTQSYRHGYLVPVISCYLLWECRSRLAGVAWTGNPWALPLLLGAVWLWYSGSAASVQSLEHGALFLMLLLFINSVVGNGAFRRMAFPLGFLIFAMPVGRSIVPFLMEITADISSMAVRLIGIPIFRDGMLISLPNGNFEVADVCSGYNYLNAGVTIATLIAYISFVSNSRRILYVVFAAIAFLTANGVRVFLTMLIASKTNMRYMVGMDHVVFGWVLFAIVLGSAFWLAAKYSDGPILRERHDAN